MAFRQFDLNGDGYITRPEFQAVMGGIVLDQMSWNEFLLYCDSDKDERVSIREKKNLFLTIFRYRKKSLFVSWTTIANKITVFTFMANSYLTHSFYKSKRDSKRLY